MRAEAVAVRSLTPFEKLSALESIRMIESDNVSDRFLVRDRAPVGDELGDAENEFVSVKDLDNLDVGVICESVALRE